MNIITVDIETRPLPNNGNGFDPKAVRLGNLKDAEKIKAKIVEAKTAYQQGNALDPFMGAVCAIGILNTEEPPRILYAYNEKQEKEILTEFWKVFGNSKVVGHNFRDFDMPFIVTRSRILNVSNRLTYGKKYGNIIDQKIEDTMEEIACHRYGKNVSLKAAATAFNVRSNLRQTESSSEGFWRDISSGDAVRETKAENHLLADLQETQALAIRCGIINKA